MCWTENLLFILAGKYLLYADLLEGYKCKEFGDFERAP